MSDVEDADDRSTDPAAHDAADAHTDFASAMSYGDYLGLPPVLSAAHPLTDAHDELLFIIQHQTSELWMKLAIHELDAAIVEIAAGRLRPSFKMLTRVARIFEQLKNAWDVLRTMTPSEYARFRDELGVSSGFQSYQYRAIEFLCGNKDREMLRAHQHDPAVLAELERRLHADSLYDVTLQVLSDAGFDLPEEVLSADRTVARSSDPAVLAAWQAVYADPQAHWSVYELGEKLVDLEDYFRRWRFNHVTTVERIIGSKTGTGGTSGVQYLKRRLDVVLFDELWEVRAAL
ncbi:tryptophan 2,3-dioxygenase [Euzebya tangerina]|uniref:tryptophan 2,3-dioxygenase n=1 Tax=Euzebya tangerina TaxID=591198 RepID=UPI00196B454E|nr:tryptophan 2,3-dioxygenase [Euzebya tangerina]